jgi:hypothetical protein
LTGERGRSYLDHTDRDSSTKSEGPEQSHLFQPSQFTINPDHCLGQKVVFNMPSIAKNAPPETSSAPALVLLKAKDITLPRVKIENEVIPLGKTHIEVELAMVHLEDLKFDRSNPRVAFRLKSANEENPSQEHMEQLLWGDDNVKKLKNSIELYGGLIEALIVANDGTVLEGNCRLACLRKLHEGAVKAGNDDSPWRHVKARVLAPGIDRSTIELLLGELHFAGKNEWTAFEQASHIYQMVYSGDETVEELAKRYRTSKSYVVAKNRAYMLMRDKFVPLVAEVKKEEGSEIKNPDRYWSWFEEFYKTCKPTPAGKEPKANRVYDGEELEDKFCRWVAGGKLPRAENVRKLPKILDHKAAMKIFEEKDLDAALKVIEKDDPTMNSKLWKQIQTTAELLAEFPLAELDRLRDHDPAKTKIFADLASAVTKVATEVKK